MKNLLPANGPFRSAAYWPGCRLKFLCKLHQSSAEIVQRVGSLFRNRIIAGRRSVAMHYCWRVACSQLSVQSIRVWSSTCPQSIENSSASFSLMSLKRGNIAESDWKGVEIECWRKVLV